MNTELIITKDGSHTLLNTKIKECYHSRHGAIAESNHVFIKNGFSYIKKDEINILEIGFGTGLNTLLTSEKAIERKIKTNYHTIDVNPIDTKTYTKLNFTEMIGLKAEKIYEIHEDKWG